MLRAFFADNYENIATEFADICIIIWLHDYKLYCTYLSMYP